MICKKAYLIILDLETRGYAATNVRDMLNKKLEA